MASSSRSSFNTGYRSWFQPYRYGRVSSVNIFILDYETDSHWEDQFVEYSDYDDDKINTKSRLINGIQIYFLDENHQKRKAFLRHAPYFFLLIKENLSKSRINRIISQIYEYGEKNVIKVEEGRYYDADNLTFLNKKNFLKVTADRPSSVPNLRKICEGIKGIVEWREADVLYHHRVAIDFNVRVGSWYTAEIRAGEIINLVRIPDKTPPELRILAFDIETVFEQTREPNPNRDAISMISLFSGIKSRDKNLLIVNSDVIKAREIRDFDILLRPSDNEHSLPWVDWQYSDVESTNFNDEILEQFPVKAIIVKNEKELIDLYYQFISDFRPDVLCDFFGGRFDIPFLAVRSDIHNKSLEKETGFRIIFRNRRKSGKRESLDIHNNYAPSLLDYVTGAGIIHLDAYLFNEKYSYLPKKDLGLKPSVQKKLKIIPISREALFTFNENPAEAAAYAGCDGYITWKYCKEIVLDFFISMGQMFPVPSSELLTRRSGSLDDLLIDAEDHKHQIIGKRRTDQKNIPTFSSDVVIDSLAYTGGLVEARRPGIFRSDIVYDYEPNKNALEGLKEIIHDVIKKEVDNQLKKMIKVEFNEILSQKIDNSQLKFNGNPDDFIEKLEIDLLRNGASKEEFSEKMEFVRNTLEKIPSIKSIEIEDEIQRVITKIDETIALTGKTQLRGVHVDVTSMYPSQIRQYKLQPSSIVPLTLCRTCELYESDNSCFIEGDWIVKLTAHRPCRFKLKSTGKCDPEICTSQDESKCKKYEPNQNGKHSSQEIFTFDGKQTKAYVLTENKTFKPISLNKTYFGSGIDKDPFVVLQQWLRNTVEATQLTTKLNENRFEIFEDLETGLSLPLNTFMSLDVRTKNISILLSVSSRVCQKAYNFVSRIMDDFFNTRVRHKIEAQRLKQIINQKKEENREVSPELLKQQKYHDSTQLGLKVPLNSIYGLLGMKSGVRNSSTPCAGITTKLSADLIYWAANQLEEIGLVTELDTDGIWLWVPKSFPLDFSLKIKSPMNKAKIRTIKITLLDKILNAKVESAGFRNDNYWINDGKNITRAGKSLIKFEQDGPYDFMFIMGKKKYIVYNYNKERKIWIEKELTGLESKRADFSQLQKYFQERVINSYLEFYDPENPISLNELYENAIRAAEEIRLEITQGKLDPSYFVKPKAINKPLRSYKSKLPQVTAAYILKDLGFSVDPGVRVQMLNIKGNHVIPRQVFDFSFNKIKDVLMKHGICTLSFMLGEVSNKDELHTLIDVNQYLVDIYGPGRIYDRMVRFPMKKQQVLTNKQQSLDIQEIKVNHAKYKSRKKKEKINLLKNGREQSIGTKISKEFKKRHKNDSKSKFLPVRNKMTGLDEILDIGDSEKKKINHNQKIEVIKKISDPIQGEHELINQNIKKVKTLEITIFQTEDVDLIDSDDKIQKSLITLDEIEELENNEQYTNGYHTRIVKARNTEEKLSEELTVCSECGALISYQEITDEGCVFCMKVYESNRKS